MNKSNYKNRITELKKSFKKLRKKLHTFLLEEGKDLDKDIFINSDQGLLKLASSLIIFASLLGIGWLAFAKTDEIIIVQGKIIPIGKVKEIKMPMSGVIEIIKIKEGDLVEENQELMRIESDTNSNLSTTLENSIKIKKQQIKSLNSEILLTKEIYSENKKILKNKIDIYQSISDRFETLLNEGAVSELDFLNQEMKLKTFKSDLLQYELDWTTKSKSQEVQMQELQNSLNKLKGEFEENNINLGKKILYSPVNGYVFDLKPVIPGYSAQMTETIVKIVPMGDLIAYLEIPSSDIGFVKKGMDVDISIDSYPASDFGVIKGNIISIGTDALDPNPSEQRNQFVYPARIELISQKLQLRRGKKLDLKVGMSLQGNIKLRKVSYLQLLFSTFKDKTKSIQEL